MPETETIQVLGRGTNVDFSIDDSVPFHVAERSLRDYLSSCRGLYSRGTVTVNVGSRILAPDQMATIKGILGQETGLTVTRYWCPPEVLSKALAGPECRRALPSPSVKTDYGQAAGHGELSTGPEDDRQHGNIEEVAAEPTSSTDSVVAESPVEKQLAMAFPDLDGGLPVNKVEMPATKETPVQEEMTVTVETTGEAADGTEQEPVPGEGQGNEPEAAVVPADAVEDEEAGAEAVHEVFQSLPGRGSEALIIKNTCRSGEVVRYPGDVVVFGDVNPGAEIVAAGDIMVLGALRGMAHAGADGNLKATIFALNLESHRLQIGPHVGERPRGARKGKGGRPANPQIAYLRRRSIFVAPFERRSEEYHGGVPYEG